MNIKDVPILKQKVLDLLPITQSDVCKNLDIDSHDGSKLVSIMVNESLIKRTRSGRTFLLERLNGNGKKESEDIKSEKTKHTKKKSEKIKHIKHAKKSLEDTKDGEKPKVAKKESTDISILRQKVLDMLPAMQSEICKSLGIDSRNGSRLISIMSEEGLIRKTRSNKTFLVERLDGARKKKSTEEKQECSPLLSKDGSFSPCCGCEKVCKPGTCVLLDEWLL